MPIPIQNPRECHAGLIVMLRITLAGILLFSLPVFVRADYDSAVAALEANDYETAFNEFLLLAKEGNAEAQNRIGMMYQGGMGVPQDPEEALKWYQKSAEDGFTPAQLNLGSMYRKGVCIPPDYIKASEWYRRAAEQGVSEAQYNLGILYFSGNGLPRDVVQAYAWVDVAAADGNERARDSRGVIESELDPAQLEDARRLAGELWEKYGNKERAGDRNINSARIKSE